jgi:signal transduction histidine kinase
MVEDNVNEYTLVNSLLQKIAEKKELDYSEFELIWAESLSGAKARLSQESFDMIFTDLSLRDAAGVGCISTIQSVAPHLPLVVLTKDRNAGLIHDALQNGAQDYLIKGEFDSERLARSVRYAMQRHRMLQKLETESHYKSELLTNMAEDIRAPITAIIELAEQIKEGQLPLEAVKSISEGIVESGHRLLSILDDVISMSSANVRRIMLQSRPCLVFNLVDEVERLMKPRAQEKKISFTVAREVPLPKSIVTDPSRLKQVLISIVDNAIKYTNEGNVDVTVRLDIEKEELVFTTIDTGIGITKERLARILTPVEQKPGANAAQTATFGLSLTKRIAETLGGSLLIESSPGCGTRAEIRIPTGVVRNLELVTDLAAQQSEKRESYEPLKGKVVVVADKENRLRLARKLREMSLQVSSPEQLSALNSMLVDEEADGLVIDFETPGIDGCNLVKEVRDSGYRGSVVAVVDVTSAEKMKRYMQSRCDRYVAKPLDYK